MKMIAVGLLLMLLYGAYGEHVFVFSVPENGILGGVLPEAILYILNPGQTDARVQVDTPLGTSFSTVVVDVPAMSSVAAASIPYDLMLVGNEVQNLGFRVTASSDVHVQYVNYGYLTADGTPVPEVGKLGTDYIAVTYRYASTSSFQGPYVIGVTATESPTYVTVTPTVAMTFAGVAYGAGQQFEFQLDAYECVQLQSSWSQGDLTGSLVHATAPVYVTSGAMWSSVSALSYPDHLVHALPPVPTLGLIYVVCAFQERRSGDLVKIVGTQEDTSVSITDSGGTITPVTLMAGEQYVYALDANDAVTVVASKPVLVAQLMKSFETETPRNQDTDPSLVVHMASDQWKSEYVVHQVTSPMSGDSFSTYVNLVVGSDATGLVSIPGVTISWKAVASTGFSVAVVPVTGFMVLTGLEGSVFGASVYGHSYQESLGHWASGRTLVGLETTEGSTEHTTEAPTTWQTEPVSQQQTTVLTTDGVTTVAPTTETPTAETSTTETPTTETPTTETPTTMAPTTETSTTETPTTETPTTNSPTTETPTTETPTTETPTTETPTTETPTTETPTTETPTTETPTTETPTSVTPTTNSPTTETQTSEDSSSLSPFPDTSVSPGLASASTTLQPYVSDSTQTTPVASTIDQHWSQTDVTTETGTPFPATTILLSPDETTDSGTENPTTGTPNPATTILLSPDETTDSGTENPTTGTPNPATTILLSPDETTDSGTENPTTPGLTPSSNPPATDQGFHFSWMMWSPWSRCSKSCGGGASVRIRLCSSNQIGACERRMATPYTVPQLGYSTEQRPCSPHPCPVGGWWAPWGAWAACGAGAAGAGAGVTCGVRQRTRTCIGPWYGGRACVGEGRQHVMCTNCTRPAFALLKPSPIPHSSWTKSDERRSAIGLGVSGLVFVASLLGLFFVMDFNTYRAHWRYMCANVFGGHGIRRFQP